MDVILSKMGCLSIDDMGSLNNILANMSIQENNYIEYLSWSTIEEIIYKNRIIYVIPPRTYNSVEILERCHPIFKDYSWGPDKIGLFVKKDGLATTCDSFDKWILVTPELIRNIKTIDNKDRVKTLIEHSTGISVKEIEESLDIKKGTIRRILKNLNVSFKKVKNQNLYYHLPPDLPQE
jgi:hypothetical protein